MFEKSEYVVSGSKGVCVVEDITTLDISGVDKGRVYYILKPVYMNSSTIYVPVDTAEGSLRKVLSREEADRLIQEIPDIPMIPVSNDKLLEQEYRGRMRTNDCTEWVRVIKTIYMRKKKRLEAGRKITALDAKYYRLAEDNLCGELAVALQISRGEVEDYIAREIQGRLPRQTAGQ